MNNELQPIEITCLADKALLPKGKACTRVLEISMTARSGKAAKDKPALNLGIVLDRSGSMGNEKLHNAKQAATHLLDLLSPNDKAALVIYDNEIEVLSPSLVMTDENKRKVKQLIQEIYSRGSTNLFGGWLKGCEKVAENSDGQRISRVLLLSDGLANAGETNLDAISLHVSQLFQRGISTSCFGIGLDYNEHLLEAMANSGGGSFQFLEALSTIPHAFEREFQDLISTALRDAEIQLSLPSNVNCSASGGWLTEKTGASAVTKLGCLYEERQIRLYYQLHFPANLNTDTAEINVNFKGLLLDGTVVENEQSVCFKFVPVAVEESAQPDPGLMERFALVDMADKATEALRRARAGDRDGASQILFQTASLHRQNLPASAQMKYANMSSRIREGMNEWNFKRRHQEEYESKRSREKARDYQLRLINGHMFTKIDNRQVFVDTGSPVSMGREPQWYFFDEVHSLSKSYLGVDLVEISRLVGAPIDIMLGTDILMKRFVLLDLPRSLLAFSERPLFVSPSRLPLGLFMGIPTVVAEVEGTSCQMFLDTGARLSYVHSSLVKHMAAIGKDQDFYPGMGEFETPVYAVNFTLGRESFSLRCGVLPSLLESTLLAAGKAGIFGTEFFSRFAVQLAFPEQALYLRS